MSPRRRLLTGIAAATLALACSDGRPAPVLLVGVDGFEWDVALPMLRRGELPHLAGLMERGSAGFLQTLHPTLSPVIWTSIATGKRPEEHGIEGFARTTGGRRTLYTNRDRRSQAVWNIASEHGLRVAVVGWWMTWPVEPVAGVMVAQTNTEDQIDTLRGRAVWKGRLRPGVSRQVYPEEREDEVMAILDEVETGLPEVLRATFGEHRHPLSRLGERLWSNTRWAFRADASYVRIAESLLAGPEPFDLMLVYLGSPDVAGHRFWRYREPDRFAHRPRPEEIENFGRAIEDTYAWVDGALGRLLRRVSPRTRVLVVSDHGMEAHNQRQRFAPDDPPADVGSGHHLRANPGVLVAAGPGIARGPGAEEAAESGRAGLPVLGSVLDVTPTLLALLRLPLGEDMVGDPMETILDPPLAVTSVPSHDSDAWRAAHAALPGDLPGAEQRLEQLRELGYLD